MPLPLVVPDASVLLKWALQSPDEEDAARALALKTAWLDQSIEIAVPALWAYEVGNVLGLKQPDDAEAILGAMVDLRLPEAPISTCAAVMFRLMRDHQVTFSDAAYHALAIQRGGTMLTADRRYLERARPAGHVAALSAWPTPGSSAGAG